MDALRAVVVALLLCPAICAAAKPANLPEYSLAALDLKKEPPDSLVKSYAAMLDRLEAKCQEQRSLIGDYAYVGGQELGVSSYRFMKMLDLRIPAKAKEQKCLDIAAAVVTLNRKS